MTVPQHTCTSPLFHPAPSEDGREFVDATMWTGSGSDALWQTPKEDDQLWFG